MQVNFNITAEEQKMLLTVLSEYRVHLCGDVSGSMAWPLVKGQGRSRFQAMEELFGAIWALGRNPDGTRKGNIHVDASLFGNGRVIDLNKIEELDDTLVGGGTPTHSMLQHAYAVANKVLADSGKKSIIVLLTDGVPDSQVAVQRTILDQVNSRQEADEDVTTLFVQLSDDERTTKWLSMLDNDLPGARFDAVDAKTWRQVESAGSIAKVILESVDD